MIGMPASFDIFCNCCVKFRSESSRTVRCGAKHAMAQTRISTPVKNCLPRISQTPWLGDARLTLFCGGNNGFSEFNMLLMRADRVNLHTKFAFKFCDLYCELCDVQNINQTINLNAGNYLLTGSAINTYLPAN